MKSRPWTMPEVATLKKLWNAGEMAATVAAKLGRTERGVLMFVTKNRKRYGFIRHNDPHLTAGQGNAIDAELELAISRATMRTGRKRGAVQQRMMWYLYGESHRRKAAKIQDVGGMSDRAKANAA